MDGNVGSSPTPAGLLRFRTGAWVFASGASALIYQTTWQRELRLIFGASTAASAAVLVIFMAGLGLGGWKLGARADRADNPLRGYGQLELWIALTAALSPLLLDVVRWMYVALGGTLALGPPLASAVRLALSALVLGAPTFLMGGTLPFLAAAAPEAGDSARRGVAWLYAVNTAGAVAGAVFATFWLFENLGNRLTLWSACLCNLAIALWVLRACRANAASGERATDSSTFAAEAPSTSPSPAAFIFFAAALSGFVFFLLEMVWYRMLAPLLGGSTFTFGVILALALGGIGFGSFLYTLRPRETDATLRGFGCVCAAEAVAIALPFALGDRIALFGVLTQPVSAMGFGAQALQWGVVGALVVVPAAVAAGFQFPMLIALLGKGRARIGSETGKVYLSNTLGAIAGALAGGFGLLPFLSAPGAWRLAILLLGALGLTAQFLSLAESRRSFIRLTGCAFAALAVWMTMATGPTAFWRHTPTGAGRVRMTSVSRNELHQLVRERRRMMEWEADGLESSVALMNDEGYAFLVNGKADGHSVKDAPTQVMLGLLPALLHPQPVRACVVGLGTGSSAGWLADVPSIRAVEVIELEPVVETVAARCAPVNRNVLLNPRVNLIHGDAREVLLTSRTRYDLIVSEPSNPYRAGVASLFTLEFYEAAAARLQEGGLFAQWLQGYEIDAASVATTCATLATVFSEVEIWKTETGDLLFVASRQPQRRDVEQLRARLGQSPFKEAMALMWHACDVEGVFAHYVANPGFAREVLRTEATLNTDDRNALEFSFVRTLGQRTGFEVEQLRREAWQRSCGPPEFSHGSLNDSRLIDGMTTSLALDGVSPDQYPQLKGEAAIRAQAKRTFLAGDIAPALAQWNSQSQEPRDPFEIYLVAMGLANARDPRAMELAGRLREWRPTDADGVMAFYRLLQGDLAEALPAMEKAWDGWKAQPWAAPLLVSTLLRLAVSAAEAGDGAAAQRLFQLFEQPLAVRAYDDERWQACLALARRLDSGLPGGYTRGVLSSQEPNFPWDEESLRLRAACYMVAHDARSRQADADLREFERNGSQALVLGKSPRAKRGTPVLAREIATPPQTPVPSLLR